MGFAVRACKVNLGSDTPQNDQQAVSSPEKTQWIEAMQEELDSHQLNKTWELTELPKGRKVLPGRWVLWRGEKYMPRSRQVAGGGIGGGKEADGKWEKTEESINREPFSCISIILCAITYRFGPSCILCPRFPLVVLARPATDHSAHTPITTLSHWRPRCDGQR